MAPATSQEFRSALLKFCDEEYGRVRRKDYGYMTPDPGKLIREGLRAATSAVESAPLIDDPARYLESVRQAVEKIRQQYLDNPISDDGWDDEDGYILGGIRSVLNALEELEKTSPR